MLVKKTRIPVKHILLVGLLPSFLKKLVYRMMGYTIGKHVSLSFGSVVIGSRVTLADHCKVGFFTIVRGRDITIDRYARIGAMSVIDTEKIVIGEDARINEQVYVGGMKTPQSALLVGKRAIIMQMTYINPTLPIEIGDDTGIGGHCLLFTHGSWSSQLEGYPVTFAPIKLGNKVWLPWRVFIMPGVTVGDGSVIGANSLVGNNIPARSLAAGSPAKVLRSDYPKMPTVEDRRQITDRIFSDFFDYIRYSGYHCEVKKGGDGFVAELSGDLKASLVYNLNGSTTLTAPAKDNILFLFQASRDEVRRHHQNGFNMVVSLSDTLRIGTSASGEEVISFFSRYGIRCERLD